MEEGRLEGTAVLRMRETAVTFSGFPGRMEDLCDVRALEARC